MLRGNVISFFMIVAAISQLPLRTASADSTIRPNIEIALGFGSCIQNPETRIWKSIAGKHLAAFLLLGDTIYLHGDELADEAKVDARYRSLFEQADFRALRESTPVYGIWDDHDFGPDNATSSFRGAAVSKRVFERYFPGAGQISGLEGTIARELDFFQTKVLMLDGRTFRDEPGSMRARMLGDAQLRWIERTLKAPSAPPVVVIASGSQWLGTSGAKNPQIESFAKYPVERARALAAIAASPSTVLLLSGDRHFAEILAHPLGGRWLYEVTSSPLSAHLPPPEWVGFDPERRRLVYGENNFAVVTLAPGGKCALRRFDLFDERGEVVASFTPPCE